MNNNNTESYSACLTKLSRHALQNINESTSKIMCFQLFSKKFRDRDAV